jgi:catechol 2,3-dioxygenase-like lactoylglutathione lyase family enzyme
MAELELGWPVWIGVVSEDLEAQRRFYRDVLGLQEMEAGESWIEFDMGSKRVFELIARDPDVPQYATPGTVVGFEVEDIRAAADELGARSVEQVSGIEGGPDSGQYWCYFRDGEGNLFEIAQKIKGG